MTGVVVNKETYDAIENLGEALQYAEWAVESLREGISILEDGEEVGNQLTYARDKMREALEAMPCDLTGRCDG
jgi:hypothetical protein